ncbi:MAG: hypothetical protein NTV48_01040 [Candidatus Vogelbacteria bacterium]|nr:hypothetical protein [Candidatus Vogelbacteria bacterium]
MKKEDMQGPLIGTVILIALILLSLWFIFYKPKLDGDFTLPTTPPPTDMNVPTSQTVNE